MFTYIIFQFIWWEILLVRQTGKIIDRDQKLIELASTDPATLEKDVADLHHKKKMQVIMIVGEGTVFLLLLLFGLYKIRQAYLKDFELTNRQKNFFLSITHELKTPIAATKLQLQTLQKHKLDAEKQDQLLTRALAETERLNNLIDNLLLANHLDSGEFVFRSGNENISALTESILNRYYAREILSGELTVSLEKDIFLPADKNQFPSIVTNLVDNALKYSFAEKKINVSLQKKPGQVVLSVSDQGCGIPDTDKDKIFERFYRAGNEETRSAKGTGLGLYIVSYLAEKHRARAVVRNNTPKGSIFDVIFYV